MVTAFEYAHPVFDYFYSSIELPAVHETAVSEMSRLAT
jgi:hypothetical protein